MNSLKNLFILAVLGAVGYGVYVSLNKENQSAPPPGVADGWGGPINVQMPGSITDAGVGSIPPVATGPAEQPGTRAMQSAPPFAAAPAAPVVPAVPAVPAEAASGPMGASAASYSAVAYGAAAPPSAGPSANPPAASLPQTATAEKPEAPPQAEPAVPPPAGDEIRKEFAAFLETAQAKLDQGQLEEVHRVLTSWYGDSRLTRAESAKLTDLLDQIAGSAIYSRSPNEFAQSYTVKPGDTIETIAQTCDVPWQLLAKINGIADPKNVQPGQQLKILPGRFDAVIDLARMEMTLMLQGHYAGRFPIGLGQDRQDLEGIYQVRDKVVNPTYYGRDGVIEADDPRNPLGERWIALADNVGIHGTTDPNNVGQTRSNGSVCLGQRDIDDVFDILSVGSRVVIRR